MSANTPARRYDIDYLRVFATYLLFAFHAGMVFNVAPFYHIRNDEVSIVFLIFCGFVSLWHMPLFFVLAGWSVFASFGARGSSGFIKERVLRLFVPLIAGCILFGPLIKYFELLSGFDASFFGLSVSAELQESFREVIPSALALAPPFNESFTEFWPTYFTQMGRFTWSHLWFIAYLFTFSLLYRPLFAWLAKANVTPNTTDKEAAAKTCRMSIPGYWVYLPIIPLAVIQVTLRPLYPGIQNLVSDWANFGFYSVCMITGFLMARYPILETAVHRESKRAGLLGLAAVVGLLCAVLEVFTYEPVVLGLTAVASWSLIVWMLGFAHRRFATASARGSARLSYLAEASLPIYILHQPAIVLIGYPLIQTDLGMVTKFVLLLIASVVAAQSFYHLIARYVPFLRFAFGMKPLTAVPAPMSANGRLKPALVIVLLASAALWAATADASTGYRAADRASGSAGDHESVASTAGTAVSSGAATSSNMAGSSGTSPNPTASSNPLGLWWADRGSAKVEVSACEGDKLCGTVVWLRSPFDEHGCELRDSKNPDPQLHDRPVVGIEILRGLKASDDGHRWTGGSIYDPGSGRTYSANLELEDEHLAHFRGYVGIPLLGRTTTWVRVGQENRSCTE